MKKHGNVFKNWFCPNFLLLPKICGGCSPPPPPPGPFTYDPMSAGLSTPGQWFHILSLVKDKILFTRFCTNCFHSFEPLIQQIPVLLSSHNCVLSIVICDAQASLTEDTSLAKVTPDMNLSQVLKPPVPLLLCRLREWRILFKLVLAKRLKQDLHFHQ